MEKIKVGIIGIGHVAEFQINSLKKSHHFELEALCDIDTTKNDKIDSDLQFYSDYKEMLDKVKLDAVVVSVPNQKHYEVTNYLLGKVPNVLIEKPATLNIDDFNSLVEHSIKKNTNLVVAYHAMFAKDLIWFSNKYKTELQKDFGSLRFIRCDFYDPYLEKGVLNPNAHSLVGSWIDSGINALSVISQLVDVQLIDYFDIKSTRIETINCQDIQSTANFQFQNDNKTCIGQINTNWSLNLNSKTTHLYFDNGQYILLHHTNQQVILQENFDNKIILSDFSNTGIRLENHYIGVFDDFYKLIKAGENNLRLSYDLHKLLLTK